MVSSFIIGWSSSSEQIPEDGMIEQLPSSPETYAKHKLLKVHQSLQLKFLIILPEGFCIGDMQEVGSPPLICPQTPLSVTKLYSLKKKRLF